MKFLLHYPHPLQIQQKKTIVIIFLVVKKKSDSVFMRSVCARGKNKQQKPPDLSLSPSLFTFTFFFISKKMPIPSITVCESVKQHSKLILIEPKPSVQKQVSSDISNKRYYKPNSLTGLYTGSRFKGYQKCGTNSYEVVVEIQVPLMKT